MCSTLQSFPEAAPRSKASPWCPKQVFHFSSKTIASLAWWVFPAGFAAYASAPVRDLDPTIEFWADASLERGGGHSPCGGFVLRSWTSTDWADDASINLLETWAAHESVWLFLSLVTISGLTLIVGLLLPSSVVRGYKV